MRDHLDARWSVSGTRGKRRWFPLALWLGLGFAVALLSMRHVPLDLLASVRAAYAPADAVETAHWKADLRTLAAASRWLLAPDFPVMPVVTNEPLTQPAPTDIGGTNSQALLPTA